MAKVFLAGDWHGNTQWARYAVKTLAEHGAKRVYHLGDFGIWPGPSGRHYLDHVNGACIKNDVTLWVTPGNHEDYSQINQVPVEDDGLQHLTDRIKLVPRGYRWEDGGRSFVSLGGAPSIDFQHRMEGRSWWREEMITLREAEAVAEEGYADVMIAHDSPTKSTHVVEAIINRDSDWSPAGLRYAAEGRALMDIAVAGVQPRVFAHGHFHVSDVRDTGRTKFLSLNMDGMVGNLVALDLGTWEHEWLVG